MPAIDPLSSEERRLLGEFCPHYDLAALVDRALRHNRDLRLAALRVAEARSVYRVEAADQWPSGVIDVERDRAQINNTAANDRYGQRLSVAGVGFSNYELDLFGRVRSLSESAEHQYLATEYARQAVRVALITEVARTYVAERATAETQAALEKIHAAEQEALELAEREERGGAISGQELRWQRSTSERDRLRYQQAQVDDARAWHALQLITGYATGDLQPTGALADLLAAGGESATWFANQPSKVLTRRPDILQAEERLRAANAAIGAARAAFFPSIQLSTGVGTATASLRGLFDSATGAWLFTPRLTLPIFSGGRNRANLDLAWTRQHMAVAEYENAVQSAFREVADALVEREQRVDQLRTEQSLLQVEQEQARRTAARFESGWTDRPAVLAAQIRLEQANLALIQAREAAALNWLDLYRAYSGTRAAN
jgi:multidrug efflux system outer membrane protein